MTHQEFQQRYQYNPSSDRLGGGGFGEVFKAYDTYRDRWIALKIAKVLPEFESVRLRREVEMIGRLPTHPNIAYYEECYTFSSFDGEYDFGILQYYDEGNLLQLIKKENLKTEQKYSILKQILSGLEFLHNNGIIHRDIKPQNILIVKRGTEYIPKITDFGISKKLDANKSTMFTNSLVGAGTLAYSSPEQLKDAVINKNTDLWSFGIIAYQVLTGELPFTTGEHGASSEAGRVELFTQISSGKQPDRVNNIPEPWRTLIKGCLISDVELRLKNTMQSFDILDGKLIENFIFTEKQNEEYEKTIIDFPRTASLKKTEKAKKQNVKLFIYIFSPIVFILLGLIALLNTRLYVDGIFILGLATISVLCSILLCKNEKKENHKYDTKPFIFLFIGLILDFIWLSNMMPIYLYFKIIWLYLGLICLCILWGLFINKNLKDKEEPQSFKLYIFVLAGVLALIGLLSIIFNGNYLLLPWWMAFLWGGWHMAIALVFILYGIFFITNSNDKNESLNFRLYIVFLGSLLIDAGIYFISFSIYNNDSIIYKYLTSGFIGLGFVVFLCGIFLNNTSREAKRRSNIVKVFIIAISSITVFLLLIFNENNEEAKESVIKNNTVIHYNIGDYYPDPNAVYKDGKLISGMEAIGIVFYIENDGKNGKIVSFEESEKITWGPYSIDENASGILDIYNKENGMNATENLIKKRKSDRTLADYAVFSWIYKVKYKHKEYGIWYLPAINELKSLYYGYNGSNWDTDSRDLENYENIPKYDTEICLKARLAFNKRLIECGGVPLPTTNDYSGYWSSSEETMGGAYIMDLRFGNLGVYGKNSEGRVRAVLAF